MAVCSLSIVHNLLVFMFILLNPHALPLLLCLLGTQISAGWRSLPEGCIRAPRWSLGQCLPPSCLSALPVTILVTVSYAGSSGNSSCQGSEHPMLTKLMARPWLCLWRPGLRAGSCPSFMVERGAQRPVSIPLTEAQHNKGYKLALQVAESSWVPLSPTHCSYTAMVWGLPEPL